MTPRAAIDRFLAQDSLAVVGVSRSGKGFGNLARRELAAKGYRVYPVNALADRLDDGTRCYRSLRDLPDQVDSALIVVPPVQAVTAVRDAASAGIHHVWLQQGAESSEAMNACRELGLDAVEGGCVLMFARPSGIHKAHSWIAKLFGTLPN